MWGRDVLLQLWRVPASGHERPRKVHRPVDAHYNTSEGGKKQGGFGLTYPQFRPPQVLPPAQSLFAQHPPSDWWEPSLLLKNE